MASAILIAFLYSFFLLSNFNNTKIIKIFSVQKMKISRPLLHMAGIFCTSFTFLDCVGSPMSIDGPSMIPTINPGELVWISKLAKPKRDDIFVFTSPANPSRNHIKRVAGIPGDFVKDKQGERIPIPDHHYWMLSDNNSCPTVHDSRAYGPVHQGLLKGKATLLIWPPSRWSCLRNCRREESEKMLGEKVPI